MNAHPHRLLLGDEVLHILWSLLTTEQRFALIALREGRTGDITLADIRFIRQHMPERFSFRSVLQKTSQELADAVAEQLVANDRGV